jgi:hypothetical protein
MIKHKLPKQNNEQNFNTSEEKTTKLIFLSYSTKNPELFLNKNSFDNFDLAV